jgi:hypothetical protein
MRLSIHCECQSALASTFENLLSSITLLVNESTLDSKYESLYLIYLIHLRLLSESCYELVVQYIYCPKIHFLIHTHTNGSSVDCYPRNSMVSMRSIDQSVGGGGVPQQTPELPIAILLNCAARNEEG